VSLVHRLIPLVELWLTPQELVRIRMQAANPACHAALEFQLRRRILAERGYDPRLHDVPLPPPRMADLPPGDLDGPELVRPAGNVRLRIPVESLSPATGLIGAQGTGKSRMLAWLVEQLVDAGAAVVAIEPMADGLSRLAAARGPGRALVVRLQELPVNVLAPEPGETAEAALARVIEAFRAFYAGSGTESVFKHALAAGLQARDMAGETEPLALEDLRVLIRDTPRKRFGQAASYLDSAQRVIESPSAELRTAFVTRTGLPICELLRPGLLVIDGTGVSDGALAFFARTFDGLAGAHLDRCTLHPPPRPGFGRLYTSLDEAHIHLRSSPGVEDYLSKQLRRYRHSSRVVLLADQALEGWGPGVVEGLGFLFAMRVLPAATKAALGSLLSLPYDVRDLLIGAARPREGVLLFRGLLQPCHVRVPELAPLDADEGPVRERSARWLADWKARCAFWRPLAKSWDDVLDRFASKPVPAPAVAEAAPDAAPAREEGVPLPVVGELARDLRVKVMAHLLDTARSFRTYEERWRALGMSMDDEAAVRHLACRLGLERVVTVMVKGEERPLTIGNRKELCVATDEGLRVLVAAGFTDGFAACGKEGPVHRLIVQETEARLAQAGAQVVAGGAVAAAGGRVEPDLRAEWVDADGVVHEWAVQVQCSGNGEREADCAARLAAELEGCLVVSRNAQMARGMERRVARIVRERPDLARKLRVTDAGKVLDGIDLRALLAAAR